MNKNIVKICNLKTKITAINLKQIISRFIKNNVHIFKNYNITFLLNIFLFLKEHKKIFKFFSFIQIFI